MPLDPPRRPKKFSSPLRGSELFLDMVVVSSGTQLHFGLDSPQISIRLPAFSLIPHSWTLDKYKNKNLNLVVPRLSYTTVSSEGPSTVQVIPGNLQKYVSTNRSLLQCKTLPAHFSNNMMVYCLLHVI